MIYLAEPAPPPPPPPPPMYEPEEEDESSRMSAHLQDRIGEHEDMELDDDEDEPQVTSTLPMEVQPVAAATAAAAAPLSSLYDDDDDDQNNQQSTAIPNDSNSVSDSRVRLTMIHFG